MADLTNINMKSLREALILANTPSYLYKRLLENPSVHRLARTQSTNELLDIYRGAAAKADPSADDVALGYAALVAITLKDFREARAALDGLRNNDLHWADSIIEMFFQRPSSTSAITVKQAAPPTVGSAVATEVAG